MFATIRGTLATASPNEAIIEAGGIGYRILIPVNLFSKLPQIGEEIFLHLSHVIRENSQTLFGFESEGQREMYEVLLNVSGIGPKTALAVIGHMDADGLHQAVADKDVKAICRVPGIGKKTAERLLIEIRDKLPSQFPRDPVGSDSVAGGTTPLKMRDAMGALINLGYNQAIAQKALQKAVDQMGEEAELGVLITASLQHV